jgi:hypothetical protein
MSKKKLLEFGLKEADAFQKNFKIIFDRLVRGYKSMMGKEPEGLDLLKVKMEAREKALDTTKVVNQKGLTLDPDKPITGGTQEGIPTIKTKFDEELDEFNLTKDDPMGDLEKIVKGEGDTGLPKGQRPFGDNIRDAYREAGRSREDASEMIEALQSPGAKSSYQIMEEALGVRLYGDETFEELMKIKETGVHPRGEPPIKKAMGGQVPAAPSQLVSESDMILGYRGPGGYQGGGGNKSGGGGNVGGGGGGQDASQSDFSPSPSPASTPQDLGFIGSTTTFTPSEKYGSTGTKIVKGPTGDGPGPDYVMSTTPEPTLLEKAISTGRDIINNPITRNLGLGALTMINPALGGKIRQGMMVKGMLDLAGDISLEDLTLGGGDVTGQTTALYKDGGLASMFVEKR